MNFASDNTAGCSPEMLEALARANQGRAMPYGDDEITARVKERFSEVFETQVEVFPVATGNTSTSASKTSETRSFTRAVVSSSP